MIRKLTGLFARRKNEEKLFRTVLIAAAFMAGFISLWIGLRQSVWFDEAYSILLAQQPIAELLRLTALDTHPPLYYLILKAWASVFGWSELSLRISSVLPMMGAVAMGGLLVRRMFGTRAAVGAVLALMLAPLLLRYGFEIRMYAWASFIGITATYILYRAWQSKHRQKLYWLISYGLLVAAGTYLLYYLVFLWIAHVVWLLYVHIKHRYTWKKLVPYVLSYIGAVLLFVPWLPSFLAQTANDALAPIGQPLNLEQLLGIATFNTMYHPLYAVGMGLTAIAIALTAMLIWVIPRARTALKGKSDEIALLVMYIGVPIALLMAISLNRSMYTERYLSHVAIGLLLLLGVILVSAVQKAGREKRRAMWVLGILYGTLFIGTLHLASIGNFNFQRMQTPTVREAATRLQTCAPGTKLLVADPYVATEFSYYLPQCDLYFVSEWDTLGGGYAPFSGSEYQVKDVTKITDERITYVHYGTPDQPLPDTYKEQTRHMYGDLVIVEYQRSK